jgi:PHD/YefM family antitoxin component YafN of YafNO toxin-antitoxin module
MINTDVTKFKNNIYNVLKQTIIFNEPVNITTKDGNAVLMSESDYNGLMETVYLLSVPDMKEKLIDAKNTQLSDCIPESEVEW